MPYLEGWWENNTLRKVVFRGTSAEIRNLATLAGVYTKQKALILPPDEVLLQTALRRVPNSTIEDRLLHWAYSRHKQNEQLVLLGQQKDTSLEIHWEQRLRAYQRVGAAFLQRACRAIVADDRGLGKTATAILASCSAPRVLVVAPAYLKRNWFDEIHKWTGQDALLVNGSRAQRTKLLQSYQGGYCIVNYEMLRKRKDGDSYRVGGYPELLEVSWDAVIFDEAHRLKDRKSQSTQGAFSLKADHVYFLTGTPLLNKNPAELWSMLHIIEPLRWSSYWAFVERFCAVEETFFGKQIVGAKNTDELKQILAPIMLRRLKEHVTPELPPKVYQNIFVKLEPKHRRIYEKAEKQAVLELPEDDIPVPSAVALITRLRQIATYPAALDMQDFQPKTSVLLDLLEDIISESKQVVVFGWYKAYLHHLQQVFSEKGWSTAIITGDTTDTKRYEIQQAFQAQKLQILIGSMAAIGEGLNLDSADTAIFVEIDWVPARNEQAEDRLHRLTTTRSPTIIRLIAEGTIDVDILSVVESKRKFIDETLSLKEVIYNLIRKYKS